MLSSSQRSHLPACACPEGAVVVMLLIKTPAGSFLTSSPRWRTLMAPNMNRFRLSDTGSIQESS